MHPKPGASFIDTIEENLIAILLGSMTLITFANVLARKFGLFGGNILWALEATVFLFAWLVLLGASYAVKKSAHLGVDVIVNTLNEKGRKVLALIAVSISIAFTLLLLKGAWDYWANFANLPQTEGRWFPIGLQDMKPYEYRGWYAVDDIPNPAILSWLEPIFNNGEPYLKMPRLVPYLVLPLSMALMLLRFIQTAVAIWNGKLDRIVASHEVEDEIAEVREQLGEED